MSELPKELKELYEERERVRAKLHTKATELGCDMQLADSVLGIGKQIDILIGNIMLVMGEDDGTNYVQGVIDEVKENLNGKI
tara:strand:+ start:609 stop:854 length:246 start_codon:yes stop_codon:yes gene_type:complete